MRITIGKKLSMGFAVVLVLMGITGIVAYNSLVEVRTSTEAVRDISYKSEKLSSLFSYIRDGLIINDIVVGGNIKAYDYFRPTADLIEEEIRKTEGLNLNEKEKELYQSIKDNFLNLRNYTAHLIKLEDPIRGITALDLVSKIDFVAQRLIDDLETFVKVIEQEKNNVVILADNAKRRGTLVILIISILAAILGLAIAFILTRTITTKLRSLIMVTEKIARGDLAVRTDVRSSDEIGDLANSFNKMADDLQRFNDELIVVKNYTGGIIESMRDALVVVNPDATIRTVNPATLELLGYREDELIGMPVSTIFVEKAVEEILNDIEEAAILVSPSFEIIAANNNFFKMASLDKKDVIGQHCYKVTHNIDRVCQPPKDKCPVLEVNKKNEPCTEWHTHIDREGKEYLVSVTAAPVRDISGEIIYYLHLAKNIKKDKEVLQDWEAIKFYAEALEKRRFFSEPNSIDNISKISVIRNLEIYCKTKTKEKIPVNLSASVMRDKEGNLVGIVCIVRDIRETKRLMQQEKEVIVAKTKADIERRRAEEIEKVYKELEESHQELKDAQSQLIHAEKMQVVGRLASGVAHEVKNPLAIILQGIDYLSGKVRSDDENVNLTLKYINEAVKRADSIVRGLLDFSSLSKLEINPENLNALIDKALSLLKYQTDKYRIQVARDLKENIPEIKIDKNRIEQVLVNLILNAIQAMPEGGQLMVKTYTEEEPVKEGWLVVKIEDTGLGIPEEILGKVFDPFFTTKRGLGGTGLGLSVVRNIIEIHNGKIEIENRKDSRGVSVTLMFKL